MYISPQDKSLLITFSGAGILILIFFFITIKPFDKKTEEEFIPIPIVEEQPEITPEEEQELEEQEIKSEKLTHQAYNSERLQREANRYFKEQDKLQDAMENASQAEEQSTESDNDLAYTDYRSKIAALRAESQEKQSSGDDTNKEQARVSTSGSRRSTVTYILNDRDAVKIPNPVYTCDGTGKVVINIEVSDLGRVTKTSYNKKASTTSDGCLVDQALQYAERAFFNKGDKPTQLGSITFEFQG
ncbi:hypothetical protein ACH3O9_08555 [Leeuwenhoekiella sp. A16]|uniref:hypothetical protein n=1 Tax=unclassified Leeuwenhoekiella TaxID=2615029 RepID=UPI003A80F876